MNQSSQQEDSSDKTQDCFSNRSWKSPEHIFDGVEEQCAVSYGDSTVYNSEELSDVATIRDNQPNGICELYGMHASES